MTRDGRIAEIKGRLYGYYQMPIDTHDPQQCASYVELDPDYSIQCLNKPGHGLGGLFCKQHAKNNPEVE